MIAQTLRATMTEPTIHDLATRRRRLRFRSTHTGTRETDILLGSYVVAHGEALPEARVTEFEQLLDANDRDIYDWITERAPVPRAYATPLMAALIDFVRNRHNG